MLEKFSKINLCNWAEIHLKLGKVFIRNRFFGGQPSPKFHLTLHSMQFMSTENIGNSTE